MELLTARKVEWLQKKMQESGTSGLIVGLSGGVDSAVVANLIKQASPDNSMALILPISNNESDIEDALLVAEKIDLYCEVIDLSDVHEKLMKKVVDLDKIKGKASKEEIKTSNANLRARLRMSTLYAVANTLNYMVVGTDNAPELYTGYFTKYGDGGVDILPIADLLKRDVYKLAKHLGVSTSVICKAPSAGLWEGQTDEEEMGVTYEKIDAYLSGETIDANEREIIETLHKKTQHKREMPPQYKCSNDIQNE
ncbi:NH(3)-dependent NAD(+) synthetase [Tindallia magadiensis]|uniref:NH(3)-dependent NAD(+) synthetase n=2 Tax=Tindallia magadiensis TaxID=69895 RepID=A0A1I3A672_9FIRM|nr:NH(3)-dependent NAD(+) synthetase [Tindallia magadiensis]